ncbi:MAG TPA: DUF480 domain-containing protein [Planctomycetaceae bacterium]|nr:DUF480 domain-containing protein [Planctomycetaceae bacterium]
MNESSEAGSEPLWKPIDRNERRVLGVLVEKAKTTPENYPLSLASLVAGSNQKSNRAPQMQLDEDDVTLALDKLRAVGAVREVQGSGRVSKFRHAAYEWLGVDSAGSAIMTELLLRGPQTMGELRARASRMHDFPDLDMVADTLKALQQSGLVQALSPPGRGQTFAHCLYTPDEQRYLAQKVLANLPDDEPATASSSSAPRHSVAKLDDDLVEQLQQRIETMEAEIEELKRRLDRIES